ncbi:TPA: tRNA uridine-5-carboxymethylaminomethyl(34) synthesis enzyme MnmG [Candidatus Gastranaerophilales bacterium HUM_6]|mgnify:FL=1|nr:MAG TPA: tRNA uridine-5-carboxymethylaminomethyl(34) synthesis enzyme MnmG [Candidatus Gastranaerophilales bacterium HUM_6]DAA96211.1 MAG TPA: tRNA uridine-5-carboxymethylaminomethyl(34) synthesis enzyme MnmG [Candidatus Gastranaerophilales bacterium HUM_7]DAB03458.1 MAG TPA: tRNA uridine-5-carboxymethylaminomethyl(34) synthesis enzyme MnmG [Candidatus Gastranaerophilales bacterium HUM_12]DAB06746.1 MAG TPA: tRNA uridine-5-carboxymethylaminomethyl(34) synthesis enzyme MnmG [Candidatus Gastran
MDYLKNKFDIIVVGAGHAGCEAALACAKLGMKVLLCTLNVEHIALQPCNPAVGGPAKSTLVREIDALGGVMGEVTDATYIQMKVLNSSKGPAVRALRAQSDKAEYTRYMRNLIESNENIYLKQCCITELKAENDRIVGAVDEFGIEYSTKAVVLTTGTSLEGRIFVGLRSYSAGRLGEKAAIGLSDSLHKLGIQTKKLKTGTPARVDKRTLDYSKMTIQPGDEELSFFSFKPNRPIRKTYPCYLTRTTEETHEIIRANLDKSPMYQGLIHGVGPRYCPSIEDKIVRFASNPSHHIFIEPEGLGTYEIYIQGFSTSLPADVQVKMIRSLPGLENAHIIKPAYAVEYDYVPAVQTTHSLMSKKIKGLFFGGQINGTSGYEEAAAQGLIAGINAFNYLNGSEMLELSRSSSYTGTLIDDLVTKDIQDPYRMLTSRSEYRLLLRQDNADERLTPIGHKIGLIDDEQFARFNKKQELIRDEKTRLEGLKIPATAENNQILAKYEEHLDRGIRASELLKRPNITYKVLKELDDSTRILNVPKDVYEQIDVIVKYDGYIKRQQEQVDQAGKLEKFKIPENIDYSTIDHISSETKEKLAKIKPKTLAQASRIGGVKPADISILMVMLDKHMIHSK